MRIGIFGHYGNGNLGDEAIIEAAIASANRYFHAQEIRLYSIVPADSAFRHDLDAYPIRRGPTFVPASTPYTRPRRRSKVADNDVREEPSASKLARLRSWLKRSRAIRLSVIWLRTVLLVPGRVVAEIAFLFKSWTSLNRLDLMIVAGSNQFLDNFGGSMGFPFTLLKWSVLCRLRGVKLVYLSIGAGPIDRFTSRMMVRLAIRMAHYHSYRDTASRSLIEGPNGRLGGQVYPDLASNLEFPEIALDFDAQQPIVAINPMPVYGDYWFIQDREKYLAYLTKLAKLATHAHNRDWKVTLFPNQTSDMDAIRDLVDILREMSPAVAESINITPTSTSQDLMKTIQSAHIIVPTRFHGAVLSILAKRLVLGVCYQEKTLSVLDAAKQGQFAFMLDSLSADGLISAFDKLWTNRNTEIESIRERSAAVRAAIETQYKSVVASLEQK